LSTKQDVRFELPDSWLSDRAGLAKLNLPIEVRDDSWTIVSRGTLQSTFELESGNSYHVSVVLPGGKVVQAQAKVTDTTSRVPLRETVPAVLPSAKSAKGRRSKSIAATKTGAQTKGFLRPSTEALSLEAARDAPKAMEDLGNEAIARQHQPRTAPATESVRVAAVEGNLLRGEFRYLSLGQGLASTGGDARDMFLHPRATSMWQWDLVSYGDPYGDLPTYIQLYQKGHPVLNYSVPKEGDERPNRISLVQSDGRFAIDVRLANVHADLMLRYSGNNMLQEVAQIADSPSLGENLLRSKYQSPIGAAVGAYTLLRLGELDRLHDWTHNLFNNFPWLPDGAVVLAEHLARIGEHQAALDTLLELKNRGLPFASSGLSFALNRLRVYQRAIETQKLKSQCPERVVALTEALSRYAIVMDVGRPLLAFSGADPTKPNANPLRHWPAEPSVVQIRLEN